MTRLDTKAIRARADAATAGPWEWQSETFLAGRHVSGGLEEVLIAWGSETQHGLDGIDEDRDFIAAARTDVPALCDRVDALEAALRGLVEYERKRRPPKMGGDEYPPSLKPLMVAARAALGDAP
jgi:hypothetical protein